MRHTDASVRQFGPALKVGAMSLAPALASAGLPQAAAATAVMGQAADGYNQLRSNFQSDVFSLCNSNNWTFIPGPYGGQHPHLVMQAPFWGTIGNAYNKSFNQ